MDNITEDSSLCIIREALREYYNTDNLKTSSELLAISSRWNWDNLGEDWTVLEGAFCRLSWVIDGLPEDTDEEYKDILQDTSDIIEALQKIIKTKP